MKRDPWFALAIGGLLTGCQGWETVYEDGVPLGTACVTVEDVEVCADTPVTATVTRSGTTQVLQVEAEVRVPGASLGYEVTTLAVMAELPADASFPLTLEAGAVLAPVLVQCTRVVAHADHCDFNVRDALACAVPVSEADDRFTLVVDALDATTVALRFSGVHRAESLDCCVNTCARDDIPDPVAEPAGKLRVAGALRVPVVEAPAL